jgi:hypothetical protein
LPLELLLDYKVKYRQSYDDTVYVVNDSTICVGFGQPLGAAAIKPLPLKPSSDLAPTVFDGLQFSAK